MNNEFEILIQGFQYDLWANRQWWAYLDKVQAGEPERTIFQHILSGQEIWLQRCLGTSLTEMPTFPVTDAKMAELNEQWISTLTTRADNPLIHYHRTDGTPYHMRLSWMARHLIDHGTYHRGELRGLCRGRDALDFPETGLAGFVLTEGLSL
jgi:uncharacterized damage-inducible protein DinB